MSVSRPSIHGYSQNQDHSEFDRTVQLADSEEKNNPWRVQMLTIHFRMMPEDVSVVDRAHLSPKEWFDLAKQLASDTICTLPYFENRKNFSLTEAQRQEILDSFADDKPALLYEKWSSLSESEKERVLAKVQPFFTLKERIKALSQNPHPSLSDLQPVLEELHRINKRHGLPDALLGFLPVNESQSDTLKHVVQRIAENLNSGEELLQLTALLRANFFHEVEELFELAKVAALKMYPALKMYTPPTTNVPLITMEGVRWILSAKLKAKRGIPVGTIVDVFQFEDLQERVRAFHANPELQRAAFIIGFQRKDSNERTEHFSTLYLEKRAKTTYIVSTDSIGQFGAFTDKIRQELNKILDFSCSLFLPKHNRQSAQFGCSTFAIKDVMAFCNILEREGGMCTWLDSAEGESEIHEGKSVTYLQTLPPDMEKWIESFESLEKSLGKTVFRNKNRRSQPLADFVQEHAYMKSKYQGLPVRQIRYKKKNDAILEKFLKYFEVILRHIVRGDEPPAKSEWPIVHDD